MQNASANCEGIKMKALILESDTKLVDEIETWINSYRSKIELTKLTKESELFKQERYLGNYSLLILNLKDPLDKKMLRLIKQNTTAPILLILNKCMDYEVLKDIYYNSYNDIIIKDFCPQEMVFRVYKLCELWNENNFYISKGNYFDFEKSIFVYDNDVIKLGPKESLMLKLLFMKKSNIVSVDKIIEYIYQNEVGVEERVRSLIRQLRAKLPIPLIKTIRSEGYMISLKYLADSV